ncbi:MAG: hypothetical protein K8J08_14630, partial [Thermoanaerobaculia bacterium]|nr:hypothetical protein [Thermoanaerobaculia bacterium]
ILGGLILTVVTYFAAQKIKEVAKDFEADPARATAEMVVKFNPDLELLESDEPGKITIREISSGKVGTFDLEDVKEGRLTFETEEGKMEINAKGGEDGGVMTMTTDEGTSQLKIGSSTEDVPRWVPIYPRAESVNGSYHSSTPKAEVGMVQITTGDSVDDVLAHYRKVFEEEGFELQNDSKSQTPQGKVGALLGTHPDGRSLTITVTDAGGKEKVAVAMNYNSPKG